MDVPIKKTALVSGAGIAGLTTAWWLNHLGYQVTVVERASGFRTGGAAINLEGDALHVARRMGLLEQLKANRLTLERWDFKNADDSTAGSMLLDGPDTDDSVELERDTFMAVLLEALNDEVGFVFGDSITALHETGTDIRVTFRHRAQQPFDLVFGCDGTHSTVRSLWFGPEADYSQFLHHYFSLTIVDKLLIEPNTAQLYNVPGKVIMLNAYNGKTDIVFCFSSAQEIAYDYRDTDQQRQLTIDQFTGNDWRTAELLAEVKQAGTAYFDKFCQIHMPSWTKGRVALVGDAAYCASPAAGMGGSLAMIGAAAVADALATHDGHYEAAFQAYNQTLRPLIGAVQTNALSMLSQFLVPATEAAIQARNAEPMPV